MYVYSNIYGIQLLNSILYFIVFRRGILSLFGLMKKYDYSGLVGILIEL